MGTKLPPLALHQKSTDDLAEGPLAFRSSNLMLPFACHVNISKLYIESNFFFTTTDVRSLCVSIWGTRVVEHSEMLCFCCCLLLLLLKEFFLERQWWQLGLLENFFLFLCIQICVLSSFRRYILTPFFFFFRILKHDSRDYLSLFSRLVFFFISENFFFFLVL